MAEVIIFDLDGLLIDSQPLQYKAYLVTLAKYGFDESILTIEDWRGWVQHSYHIGSWMKLKNIDPNAFDIEKFLNEKRSLYNQLMLDEMELKPGAQEVVDMLYSKYRLCIASASSIISVELAVKKFGFDKKFEKLISDVGMERPKPFPDPFLKAAKEMDAEPEKCIVIEDSIAGLKSAKSAGMKCIICPDTYWCTPSSDYSQADKIVDSLEDISMDTIKSLS